MPDSTANCRCEEILYTADPQFTVVTPLNRLHHVFVQICPTSASHCGNPHAQQPCSLHHATTIHNPCHLKEERKTSVSTAWKQKSSQQKHISIHWRATFAEKPLLYVLSIISKQTHPNSPMPMSLRINWRASVDLLIDQVSALVPTLFFIIVTLA